jgi:nitrogenase molybdenum-iron protein NifN
MTLSSSTKAFTTTRNACTACTPLGAVMAFAGVENSICLLHGSQGCSTYIRRYLIGHFREPMDIASSNFHESSAVFGGRSNLFLALDNVINQYHPSMIGIATTCLAETIGEDLKQLLLEYRKERNESSLPTLVAVSTPSYQGTHSEGFASTTRAMIECLAEDRAVGDSLVLLPGMVSPADLRYLKEVLRDFNVDGIVLPDFSDTMDGPTWDQYHRLPPGGTPLGDVRGVGSARAAIEFSSVLNPATTAAGYLNAAFGCEQRTQSHPIGVEASDRFFKSLEDFSGKPLPTGHRGERERLIDSYIDGHKFCFGKRAAVFGDEDMVAALAGFLNEVGIQPVLCVSGGRTKRLSEAVQALVGETDKEPLVLGDADFTELAEAAREMELDFLIGNCNGYRLSRELEIPLVRVGLPIHDRLGAARILTLGYRGTQQLYDRIINTLLQVTQDSSPVGYIHL